MSVVVSGYNTAAPELVKLISSVYTSQGFKSNALSSRGLHFTHDSPVLFPSFRQDRRGTWHNLVFVDDARLVGCPHGMKHRNSESVYGPMLRRTSYHPGRYDNRSSRYPADAALMVWYSHDTDCTYSGAVRDPMLRRTSYHPGRYDNRSSR